MDGNQAKKSHFTLKKTTIKLNEVHLNETCRDDAVFQVFNFTSSTPSQEDSYTYDDVLIFLFPSKRQFYVINTSERERKREIDP